ncbi:hypothetical protein EV641_1413 [Rhodococcus sp. SMB37]|nr:hypothetical protein EV641_1413 [Rhodococcus sp. SMB37]
MRGIEACFDRIEHVALMEGKRVYRRRKGSPTWRLVRDSDNFVVLVHGTEDATSAVREQVDEVGASMGLRRSREKTRVRHLKPCTPSRFSDTETR